jgi:hypothetical protein
MEYLISILTMIGTSIVLYFAYIKPLKKEVQKQELSLLVAKVLNHYSSESIDRLLQENKQLRKNGMYKVKKVGRPRKENK